MKQLWLTAVVVLVVAAAGCGNGGDAPATATNTPPPPLPTLPPIDTPAPRPSPTPVATYPAGARTQVDVIDRALAALEEGGGSALRGELSFHPYRCNTAPAGVDGANPCPPGVPDGAPVDVIALGECGVSFIARERARLMSELEAFARSVEGAGVYAIAEVQQGRIASPLPFRFLIILSSGHSLLLDDAGITHLGLPCDGVGPAQLYHPADRPLLPPQSN